MPDLPTEIAIRLGSEPWVWGDVATAIAFPLLLLWGWWYATRNP